MNRFVPVFLALLCVIFSFAYAQQDTISNPSREKIKTGWTFGAVPAIAFDSDIGFKYGAVINFYHFGDGKSYPQYHHSLYFEWSNTTRGSGIYQFTYDSEYLIPGIRVSAETSLLTEKALDFYGFNGYESYYNHDFEVEGDAYISRMYYRLDRKLTRIRTEFQGNILEKRLRWLAGYSYEKNVISTVDIDNLNKGKDAEDRLPDTALLYDKYIEWQLIPEDQQDGGNAHLFTAGIIYDTRDNEPNPMKGIWTTFHFIMAPSFLGNKDYPYTKMVITHRQYFTLIPVRMNLACRVSYQGKITGDMPFYMLPFLYNSAPSFTRDGLGGAKTLRGILRNRVVGEDYMYGNMELRYKIIKTVILNQNFYLAVSGFSDFGMITRPYQLAHTVNQEALSYLEAGDNEKLHLGFGGGLHFALNENFIVAVDYGMAKDKRDGINGLYINLNWLF